uniref:SGNH hydrolase-type esterase domain-containing protein n=1 Tax=Oryzias melastigma TaxID=30732 RepID=A0A3B3DTL6_ORYME
NRFEVLSHQTSDDVVTAAPPLSGENPQPVSASRTRREGRPSSSAKRRQLLRDAVSRHPDTRRRRLNTIGVPAGSNNSGLPSAVLIGVSGSKSAASPPAAGVAGTVPPSPPLGIPLGAAAASPPAAGVTRTSARPATATDPLTSAPRTGGRGDHRDSFIVGTSMVRHVRVDGSRTFCHPGALVHDVTTSAHQLALHNPSVHRIIVHAGVNDLKFQQSETLKKDFITLIHTIQQQNKQCIISGPLPSPRFGDIKFSRLRQLNIWLKGHCITNNIPYVDNFTTFYNRSYLFRPDGIHPNRTGSHLLSMNIELTLRSTKLFTN